jgi:DNA replication protein DnaC
MEWYWNLVELVLQDNSSVPSATLRTNLETQIIDFYKKLLLFQMKSACLYYRNWAGVILRDTVKLDDWAGELNTMKDAERLIQKDIEQYDNQDIRLKLGAIESSSVEQADSLESICVVLREEARLREKNRQDDKDKDCLAALLVTDPRMDKKRIQSQKGDPLKGSYEWILESDAYATFINDPSSRVLWINGPPGKGKTMLLCGIIDELEKSLRPISFFFCQANVKEEDLSSDIAVMRGLIYVLLEHQPSLTSAIRESYNRHKDRLFNSINSSELLSGILNTMLQDPCLHDTILLVDALDECNINRGKLTNLIVSLSKSCNIKWIVSSRDWPEIREELSDATGLIPLDLEQEHESVSEAVKSYIRKKVDDLAKTKWKNDLELKEKVFDYMQSHADNTFLWVALVCERLANSDIRKRLVMEELVKFPTSLTALYQAMMDRITGSSEADRLKQILASVCVVHRPLTTAEIPPLVELMAGYNEDDVKDVIASCGSFLILQDGAIFFVHQSAKEFLLSQAHATIFPHGIAHKHWNVFSRCLEAMESTLRQDIYGLGSPGAPRPVIAPSPDPLSSIRYSCLYWAQHVSKSSLTERKDPSSLKKVLHFFRTSFTCWLEALSLINELSTAVYSIATLETTLVKLSSFRMGAETNPFIGRHPNARAD